MQLCDDICRFLTANGLECTTEKAGSTEVILTAGPTAVIPLRICASCTDEAENAAEQTREVISQMTEKTGTPPLVITEDRWALQQEMMQARLLAHIRIFSQIYARNCEVRKIDKQTVAEFLAANHSYGDAACRYRYGLFLKRHTGHNLHSGTLSPGTLVAVATFSNARKWIKGDKEIRSYEWTRFASLPGLRISGGMGKMLKHFIEDIQPDDIMTYADLEWSEGSVYEQLGFTLEGQKDPVMFHIGPDWKRIPVKQETSEDGHLYFRNFGSNKYRLKLTQYE